MTTRAVGAERVDPIAPRLSLTRVSFAREAAIAAALLASVLVAAYGNIIFFGETLVSTADYSPIDDRFTHLRPGSTRGAAFLNWHDQGGVWWQWEPAGQFFGRRYRSGDVPMWDPSVAAGVDTHVNVTQAQYFLPYVLLLLAGNTPAQRDLYYLVMLLASGGACFALARRNGFHRASATFLGAGYILSGTMTQNVSALLGQTYGTLPMIVLAADVLLDRLTVRALAGAALVIGLCTYSSFLPIVISGYVLIAIQAVVYGLSAAADRRPTISRPFLRSIAALVGVVVGAVGIAAFVLVPLAVAQQGNQFFEAWYGAVGKIRYSLDSLPTILSPRLFHDVYQTFPPDRAVIPKPTIWTTHFFYAGFVVVLLTLFAGRDDRPRVRRLTAFFFLASAILFAKLMGIPPVRWIAELPVFRFLHFVPYFSGTLVFMLVGLAACGVETLISKGVTRGRFVLFLAVAAVLIASVPLFVYLKGTNPNASTQAWLRYAFEVGRVVTVIGLLATTLLLRLRDRMTGTAAGVAAVTLLAVELVPTAFHRRYQRADIWNDPPEYVRFLQRDATPFRIHSMQDPALPPNTFQGVGISGIASLGVFNQPRYTLLINTYFETQQNSGFILPRSLLPKSRSVLDLLNVKYVVTRSATPEQKSDLLGAGFTEALIDGNFAVYQNGRVLPRTYVAHDYTVVTDRDHAITAAGAIESADRVVVEQQPGFPATPAPASPSTITTYEPDRVVISGASAAPGMLVLLDAFAPGWSATMNGQPTPIVPVNAAFRGVGVPAGQWTVTMAYRNTFALAGLIVSLMTSFVALAALVAPRPTRPRPVTASAVPGSSMTWTEGPPKEFGEVLRLVYRQLYSDAELEEMRRVWVVLVRDFFQHRITPNATVVDVGAGACWFINEVRAARRIAIDANPDTVRHAAPDVEVICSPGSSLADLPDASVDHIFMSNFLEHLPSYREVIEILATAFAKLKPGGSLLILQPNYRLAPVRYFDPIDHTVVLTDRNLVLVLRALAFHIDELRVRFLPFTSKSRVPKTPWLVTLYLRLRPLQWLLGAQTFIHARRPGCPPSECV